MRRRTAQRQREIGQIGVYFRIRVGFGLIENRVIDSAGRVAISEHRQLGLADAIQQILIGAVAHDRFR